MPFGPGGDIRVIRDKRGLGDAVALGEFYRAVATKRREHRFNKVFRNIDDLDIQMPELFAMRDSMRESALFKVSAGDTGFCFYQDLAGNVLRSWRGAYSEREKKEKDRWKNESRAQNARTDVFRR